jgi:hypothetical protein
VGGSPAHAVIDTGSVFAPNDLADNYHRVGGEPAHPTKPAYGQITTLPVTFLSAMSFKACAVSSNL